MFLQNNGNACSIHAFVKLNGTTKFLDLKNVDLGQLLEYFLLSVKNLL